MTLNRGLGNATNCPATVERWDKSEIALPVPDPGRNAMDTTSAAGRFMLVILAEAAHIERNPNRERNKSAMAVELANGRRIGNVPYGFDRSANNV